MAKVWHNVHDNFNCPQTLKDKLYETFEDKLPSATALEIGYFDRRGSTKRWIEDKEDLDAMYRAFPPGEEITLWVHERLPEEPVTKSGKKRKRCHSAEEISCSSSKHTNKEDSIDAVILQLQELYKDKYSGPQLRLWARLKVNGQHAFG